MLRGPGANPPRLGRPSGHKCQEGRLPREQLAAWQLVHSELPSHHVGLAGWNEKRFWHSSEDQQVLVGGGSV
jgi:hypothetical protein